LHKTTTRFQKCFNKLPKQVQKISKKNFELLKKNPAHSSLELKKIGNFWSVRITMNHRAIAIRDDNDFIWVWIGKHDDYEKMIKKHAN
jgi:hypothetical protein